ncbi:glycine--tRNA ligase subunit beta [Candidatus Saganbacteria bacterium]|nr:glycine--tRNA ligase subunit beta [Candidatus Saganbacteria bacterium]
MSKENNLLLEIGCEEMPARFMPALLADLKKKSEEKLSAARLSYLRVETLGTHKRLVLYIEGLAQQQPDEVLEVKGPPAEAGEGAAQGFAKKYGVNAKDLKVRTEGNRNYLVATVKKKGLAAEKVLITLLPEIICSLYLPLSMRWGDLDFKFIRPIHWILALYGKKIIKFQLAGIQSSNRTCGHRFRVGTGLVPVRIGGQPQGLSLHSYNEFLRKKGVIVDQNERRALIKAKVKKAAAGAMIDEGLLEEVNYLVEYPEALVGSFDADFLSLPKDVLITSMKKNQKYFPVLDQAGELVSRFVLIADGVKQKNLKDGNQKVISARLADARFFFDEDRKLPLASRIPDLKRVEFFEKLGNLYEKTERLVKLAEFIARALKLPPDQMAQIKRIAELSKADLTTQMVFEFPELQGVMGREYARAEGEDRVVAEGIFEHYLPRFAEDKLPQSIPGYVVALADKIDTLVGCFAIGSIPTGSVDPYGLRRQALGVIKIILDKKIDLALNEIIEQAFRLYRPLLKELIDYEKTLRHLREFLGGRLKVILLEENLPFDTVDAALHKFTDVLEAQKVAKVLSAIRGEEWFKGVCATQDRLKRITKGVTREHVIEADLTDAEEKQLHAEYLKVNWDVEEKVNAGAYEEAVKQLARLTDPVEKFFEKVLVMHENERLKLNRLALLRSIEKTFEQVADFTRIQL